MQAYRVLRPSPLCPEAKAGSIVFKQLLHDYGLAADDTRATGVEHITVTQKRSGIYPGFTIPVRDLEPITIEPLPRLTDQHVAEVCRPGTESTCRYLGAGSTGWTCLKNDLVSQTIDDRVKSGRQRATGDNCEGRA